MKNSKLLLIILLVSVLTLFSIIKSPEFSVIIIFIFLIEYILIALVEMISNNDNDYLDFRIIPKKYNYVERFVNWIDSLPQIIKK